MIGNKSPKNLTNDEFFNKMDNLLSKKRFPDSVIFLKINEILTGKTNKGVKGVSKFL